MKILAVLLLFSLLSCGENSNKPNTSPTDTTQDRPRNEDAAVPDSLKIVNDSVITPRR